MSGLSKLVRDLLRLIPVAWRKPPVIEAEGCKARLYCKCGFETHDFNQWAEHLDNCPQDLMFADAEKIDEQTWHIKTTSVD